MGDLMDKVGAAVERPDPPQYDLEDVAGSRIPQDYVDEDFKVEGGVWVPARDGIPDEDVLLWADYKREEAQADSDVADHQTRFVSSRGIIVQKPPVEEVWVKEHTELYGFVVPEDPIERTIHFVTHEVIRSLDDGYKVAMGIYAASGIDEEVLLEMEQSFRAPLGRPARAKPPQSPVDPEQVEQGKEEGLVDEPGVGSDVNTSEGGDHAP